MKSKRQSKILELIKEQVCVTQEDLQNGLLKAGFDVTQSTVSRDIKELKLVKGRDVNGNYRYLSNPSQKKEHNFEHYREVFSRSAIDVVYSLNNVVVKCHNGMASSGCVAVDELYGHMMLGSLAGDDTIIIVTESEKISQELSQCLLRLL